LRLAFVTVSWSLTLIIRPRRGEDSPPLRQYFIPKNLRKNNTRDRIKKLKIRRYSLPDRVPLADARKNLAVVKLSTERKHLTNVLKTVAYQIESDLVGLVRPHYKRVEDEGRTFIQMALQNTADIEPTDNRLLITLTPFSSPHRSRALEALCEMLNKTNTLFPGTPLQTSYSVAPHHSEAKSGQVFD